MEKRTGYTITATSEHKYFIIPSADDLADRVRLLEKRNRKLHKALEAVIAERNEAQHWARRCYRAMLVNQDAAAQFKRERDWWIEQATDELLKRVQMTVDAVLK